MKKVLIIEDNINQLNLYARVLTSHGFEVEVAVDGETGIEKLETYRPDIIFLDYMLPKMDGDDFLKIVKSKPGLKSIPVIMLTVSTDKMEETFSMGATAYLHKGANTTKKILDCVKMYTR